jgi:hypothetical protein
LRGAASRALWKQQYDAERNFPAFVNELLAGMV